MKKIYFICVVICMLFLTACNEQNTYSLKNSEINSTIIYDKSSELDNVKFNSSSAQIEKEKTIDDVVFNYLNSEVTLTKNEEQAIFNLITATFEYLGDNKVQLGLMEKYWNTSECKSYFIFSINKGLEGTQKPNQHFHDFEITDSEIDDHLNFFIWETGFWKNPEIRVYNVPTKIYNTDLLINVDNAFYNFRTELINLCNDIADDAQDYNNYSVTIYILPNENYAVSFCYARQYNKENRSVIGSWLFFSIKDETIFEVKSAITFYDTVQG